MNFKNFGEALAWMMESPENWALFLGRIYRWDKRIEWFDEFKGEWEANPSSLQFFSQEAWSRAPREPLEFRWDVQKGAHHVWKSPTGAVSVHVTADGEIPNFELILKEKN